MPSNAHTSTKVVLDADIARETLIALRDRRNGLHEEVRFGASGVPGAASVAAIARRQMERVDVAIGAISAALGESAF